MRKKAVKVLITCDVKMTALLFIVQCKDTEIMYSQNEETELV